MATIADNPFPSTTGAPTDDDLRSPDTDRDAGLHGRSGSSIGSTMGASSSSTMSPGTGSSSTSSGRGSDLLDTVVQGAHSAIDRLAEAAAPAVQRLQDGMSSTGGALSERAGQVRDMGDEWAESLRVTVRENPLAAVATALAVGVLVAKLTQR